VRAPTLAVTVGVVLAALACSEPRPAPKAPPVVTAGATVAQIKKEARALTGFVKTALAKEFLAAADDLPSEPTRRLWHDAEKTRYITDADHARLDATAQAAWSAKDGDEELYYVARFGTPIAYARPLDLLGLDGAAIAGRRVIDFGFGAVGHLRMLASLGAHAVGIEVDPLSRALYTAPSDQGAIAGRHGQTGDLTLLFGRFPAEDDVRARAGGGYDLFLSKNVLKRGYIHPERPAPEKQLIKLGVDDEAFVRAVFAMLVPGGRALIYNLAPPPAPPEKPYIPWADGRCPFAREVWEKVGFRVIEFDRDDTPAAREMGHLLGWDQEDGGNDLFATFTLAERPKN
jgi:SAM-dependent methyltransferase